MQVSPDPFLMCCDVLCTLLLISGHKLADDSHYCQCVCLVYKQVICFPDHFVTSCIRRCNLPPGFSYPAIIISLRRNSVSVFASHPVICVILCAWVDAYFLHEQSDYLAKPGLDLYDWYDQIMTINKKVLQVEGKIDIWDFGGSSLQEHI